jgi:hypothetical protein
LSLAIGQPDAIDITHRRLLADAHDPRRNPTAATAGQRRVFHHPFALVEDRGLVRETASRIKLAFAADCPDAELFRSLIMSLRPT